MKKVLGIVILVAGLLVSRQLLADINIQPGIGGTWVVPGEDGHGLFINMTEVNSSPVIVVSWYHYLNGQQIYLIGSANYQPGAQSVTVPMIITSGSDFGDNFNQADVVRTDWGTLTFRFTTCIEGEMDYASGIAGFGTGTKTLTRLTNTAGVACQANQANSPGSSGATGSLVGRNFDGVVVRSEQLVTKSSALSFNQSACHIQITVDNTANESKNFLFTYGAKVGGSVIASAAALNADFSAGGINIPAKQTAVLEGIFRITSLSNQGQLPDLSDICNGNIPDIPQQTTAFVQCGEIESFQAQTVTETFNFGNF